MRMPSSSLARPLLRPASCNVDLEIQWQLKRSWPAVALAGQPPSDLSLSLAVRVGCLVAVKIKETLCRSALKNRIAGVDAKRRPSCRRSQAEPAEMQERRWPPRDFMMVMTPSFDLCNFDLNNNRL